MQARVIALVAVAPWLAPRKMLCFGVGKGQDGYMSAASSGQFLRELRLALGWSQARLADEVSRRAGRATVTRDEVKRWESGKRRPGPFWLAHLAGALEVPLGVLEVEGDVKRRAFLSSTAATVIAPVVASDLLARGFDARLGNVSTDWDGKVEAYGRDYMTLGAGEIQRRLTGDLVVLQQEVESPHTWQVAAKLMTLYGKTFPGSDGAKAAHWYRKAAMAADRGGDLDTAVWVRGRAAIALGYEGAALPVAGLFADQAMQMSGKPSLGLVNAVMGKAHVSALQGDAVTALELADRGRRVFDSVGSDDQATDYAVPWWRFNVFVSLLAARLGGERLALEAQEQALAELPAELPRFRTHLMMHRGLMMARAGDPAGAAYARAALDELPPEKHSLTLRMLMAEISPPAGPSLS